MYSSPSENSDPENEHTRKSDMTDEVQEMLGSKYKRTGSKPVGKKTLANKTKIPASQAMAPYPGPGYEKASTGTL